MTLQMRPSIINQTAGQELKTKQPGAPGHLSNLKLTSSIFSHTHPVSSSTLTYIVSELFSPLGFKFPQRIMFDVNSNIINRKEKKLT